MFGWKEFVRERGVHEDSEIFDGRAFKHPQVFDGRAFERSWGWRPFDGRASAGV